MNRLEIDLSSLPLHDLLSAPLTAAMDAQQQASLGLVSLIQDLGFTIEDDRSAVRMVEFRYAREGRDADGNPVTFDTRLRIPLLTMISLPHLEIERLGVNFLAGLQSVSVTDFSPRLGISRDLQDRYPFLQGYASLRVAPTPRTTVKGTAQTTRPYDLEVTLAVTAAELTDGTQRILTTLTGETAEEAK